MSIRAWLRLVFGAVVALSVLLWARQLRSGGADESHEVARIQAHILGAERMAATRDISGLTPSARKARLRLLRELRAYRERGVFPKNRDFPGRRVPYFIDADGVRCAMAHLIEFAGGADLVQHVARTRNNAYVRELVNEPGLVSWLDRNGLTVQEAARIQPEYGQPPIPLPDDLPRARSQRMGLTAAGLGVGAGGVLLNLAVVSNPTAHRWHALSGFGLGVLGTTAGAFLLADQGTESKAWASTCMMLGTTSMVLGMHRLTHAPSTVAITPMVWRKADGTPGVALRMVF